jgi:hypothetical protein
MCGCNWQGSKKLPQSLPERNKGDVLIFFKLYDPEKESLQ